MARFRRNCDYCGDEFNYRLKSYHICKTCEDKETSDGLVMISYFLIILICCCFCAIIDSMDKSSINNNHLIEQVSQNDEKNHNDNLGSYMGFEEYIQDEKDDLYDDDKGSRSEMVHISWNYQNSQKCKYYRSLSPIRCDIVYCE